MNQNFTPFNLGCYTKLSERFQYLFEAELINEICKNGKLKHFRPNETLIEVGDTIEMMPLIISGSIKIMTEDENGDELLLYFLEYGDTCAMTLNCCMKRTKSAIRAVAEVDSEILFIPIKFMNEWMIQYNSWRSYVLDSYNTRVNELLKAIDNLVFNSMEDRLQKYLEDKVWMQKTQQLQISHSEIAKDLHSSRVVISRLMKKLEKDGFVKQGRNLITVLN